MHLQSEKSPNGEANMVALCPRGAHLGLFDAATLLQAAMIFRNRPLPFRPLAVLEFTYLPVISGPVVNVAVWGNELETWTMP